MTRLVPALALALTLASPFESAAHPLAPSLLQLDAEGDEVVVTWRTPIKGLTGAKLAPLLPDTCLARGRAEERRAGSGAERVTRYTCPGGLVGARVGVQGLEVSETNALLLVRFADGRAFQTLLHGESPTALVPPAPSSLDTALDYAWLGAGHLAGGLDHVLFVLGLLLIVRGRRRLILAVTSFTLGHSLTLALATLGLVRLPQTPVEILIALSIALLAAEALQQRQTGQTGWLARHPALVCAAFGLLHGLGFAGALSETGLPDDAIPLALASFNLGIELAQIALILVAAALARLASALHAPLARALPLAVAYLIGSLGALWVLERSLSWSGS